MVAMAIITAATAVVIEIVMVITTVTGTLVTMTDTTTTVTTTTATDMIEIEEATMTGIVMTTDHMGGHMTVTGTTETGHMTEVGIIAETTGELWHVKIYIFVKG